MPPKKVPINPQKKTKKAKFSATMPEFNDNSQDSSNQSESNESDLDKKSNSQQRNSDQMEVSQSSSSESSSTNQKPYKAKPPQKQSNEAQQNEVQGSQGSSQGSQEGSSEGQQSSSSEKSQEQQSFDQKQPLIQQNKKKPPALKPSFNVIPQASYIPAQQSVSQKTQQKIPHSEPAQQQDDIPRQQVETDDFDSQLSEENQVVSSNQNNASKNCEEKREVEKIIEEKNEVEGSKAKKQESESDIYEPLKNQYKKIEEEKIVVEGEHLQQAIHQQEQQIQKIREENQQNNVLDNVQDEEQEQDKKKKKKQKKKSKKSKKKDSSSKSLQQKPSIPNPSKIIPDPEPVPEQHIPNMKKQQDISSDQQTGDDDEDDQTNLFYEVIYPYLTGIGQLIINDFMKTNKGKKKFTSLEALKWGRGISNTFLTKAFMSEVQGIDHLEEDPQDDETTKNQKLALVEEKLKDEKFYRKIQKQLSKANLPPVNFGEVYFLMKRFKLIASCLVIEKKRGEPIKANINTSCYWNKEKDGRINFSSEGESVFIMFTVYGLEIPKEPSNDE